MIGLALSGGGSRAIAFHLGCLRALNDLGLLDKIGVLSTISGGSVIGAYYAYTPGKSFDEFDSEIRNFLRRGIQRSVCFDLLKPTNLVPCFANFVHVYFNELITCLGISEPKIQRYPSRTDIFHKVISQYMFPGLTMNSPRRHDIEVVIGACELRTGSAFRFSSQKSGGWRQGELVDREVDVALAVAASAAYPLLLPALDRIWKFRKKNGIEEEQRILLTDGGIYDNLGLQVLEPGRDHEVSLHMFPCDYLISCNAGQGQESGKCIPLNFIPRVFRSFEIVHRRVQDSTMHRLHHLKCSGSIKGFALPYLGQLDDRLPWKPSGLVPREDVINYPTNFAAMSDEWIDKISMRGEQLTRALISYYLYDLLNNQIE